MDGEEHYRKAIEAAEKDLAGWFRLRNAADLKVGQLKSAIAILKGLIEAPSKARPQEVVTEEIGDLGITEAIRAVLRTFPGVCQTPANVKESLIGMNFNLSEYRNPSAVIHNTLKRLETQQEVQAVNTPSGTAYMLSSRSFEYELQNAGIAASSAAFEAQEKIGIQAYEAYEKANEPGANCKKLFCVPQ